MQRALSTGTLLDLPRLYRFLDAMSSSLTTDKDFGPSQIRRLAEKLHSMSPSRVQLLTVPLETGSFNTPAGNVVKWDPVLAPQLFADITADRPIDAADAGRSAAVTIPPSSIPLQVRNATGTHGLAARVASDLGSIGFAIRGTGNAPAGSDPKVTVVRYGPGRTDSARTVLAAIPGAKGMLDPGFGDNIEVIIGADFRGVQRVAVSASPARSAHRLSVRTAADDICR
jgi:hypothetical protein